MDDRRGRTSEYMDLDNASTAYLLGKQGVTKNRLAEFTGCGLEIGHAKVGASQHTLSRTLSLTATLPSPSPSLSPSTLHPHPRAHPRPSPLPSPSTPRPHLAPSPSLLLSPRWS